jgi:Txe/YoeB family toxin of Txe-Axe toxin-antitoxin module
MWARWGHDVTQQHSPLQSSPSSAQQPRHPLTGEYLKPDGTPDFSTPVPGRSDKEFAAGKGNEPGKYAKFPEPTYFEKAFPSPFPTTPEDPPTRAMNVKLPAFETLRGDFENAPGFAGGPDVHRYEGFKKSVERDETASPEDVLEVSLYRDHHPDFDYTNRTLKVEFLSSNLNQTIVHADLHKAKMSLYKQCLKGMILAKHFYMIPISIEDMKRRIRGRFYFNAHVQDVEAIRHLIYCGLIDYHEIIGFRKTRVSVMRIFGADPYEYEEKYNQYAKEERDHLSSRSFFHGEEQRREGPYEGHWSEGGLRIAKEFERLAGRIPRSWTTSKGYFEKLVPDGTNYWERNLDYEGWYISNVNPDLKQARQDHAAWMESSYNQPKHYASKNRRSYRRMVKDIETVMETSIEDLYTQNREQIFQNFIRDGHAETNRVSAEKRLAMQDDDVYSTRWEEFETNVKQVMREMPNPRLWKTDAFYFRLRYLMSSFEYNWAKVAIGAQQEKQYNEWISDTVNYVVLHSEAFRAVKASKVQNPMANTFGDFYLNFDPDVPQTRRLPWYHAEFNYDRRYKWDERCMRMKRWVQSGTIDVKRPFFDSYIAEWEQFVNRPEIMKHPDRVERRYCAPRMVQLYRALNKLMDVALTNQLVEVLCARGKTTRESLAKLSEAEVQKKVAALDLADFKFDVPVLIYPDGVKQPILGLDGRPIA